MASQELSVGQGQDAGVPVAIYTRVSTDNQTGGRFDSCESQAAICREMIRKREPEGWHEIACFSDAAYFYLVKWLTRDKKTTESGFIS